MFVKSRLNLADKRFTRDMQWIFHEMNLADMRAIDSGIYVCLNTKFGRPGMTAGWCVS